MKNIDEILVTKKSKAIVYSNGPDETNDTINNYEKQQLRHLLFKQKTAKKSIVELQEILTSIKQDSVELFIKVRCIIAPKEKVSPTPLFEAYKDWCIKNSIEGFGLHAFSCELKRLKFEQPPKSGNRVWAGISLKLPKLEHGSRNRRNPT